MGKYIFLSLLLIWYCAFVAGFAFGQTNQDCVYVNNIVHDKDGRVVSSSQEYVCKTPPKVVEIHTYPNKDSHDVMKTKVYGIPLNAYENPSQVLYNMQEDLLRARKKEAFNAQISDGTIKGMFYLLSLFGN